MIRAPGINGLLGALRTARQVLSGRNAFQDLAQIEVARLAASTSLGHRDPGVQLEPLDLHRVSSAALWWLACRRAKRQLQQGAEVNLELCKLSFLVILAGKLRELGPLRGLSFRLAGWDVKNWMQTALRGALLDGKVIPGTKNGITARMLMMCKVEASTADLLEKELRARNAFQRALTQAFQDGEQLHFTEAELAGVPEQFKKRFTGPLQRWQKGRFKIPVGREAMNHIVPYCSVSSTRHQLFEAYYRRFGSDFHASALELLRARQQLAKQLGFRCWADYELRPLSEVAQDSHAASKLFEDCWRHLEPAVASAVQKMKGKAGVLQQPDEAYYWTLHGRAVEALKLAEYLPAEQALERLVDVLGRACNITFRALPARSWWQTGWHSGVRCFEVLDGPPLGIAAGGGRCLGYVYVELYGTWRGTRPLAPGALLLAPGHVYLGLHLQAPSMGMTKLLTPEDATMMAHELGHAVHMLCFSGSAQEFQDLPLDLLELPSTFAEVLATKPEVVGEYARHHQSGDGPPNSLLQVAQANPNFFAQKLQSWNVSLGLHSDFDAFAATPSELQDRAVSLWQRYSKVAASGSFSPLGEDAGGCLALGANQVAYLLCYLRTATLLRGKSAQGKSALKRWLSPDAAGKLRAQLLDQRFNSERLATLLPTLQEEGMSQLPHPLPPLPSESKPGSAVAVGLSFFCLLASGGDWIM
ncbi:unnamed protein product [Durusdinium trenchii]|uniref:Peptidase M3A/M3B catalytic domain-containing protein n=1 Tax=Durusdinium trenchii TaxID=1381693 RepID=A0ABP0HH93_9DINO